MDYDISAKIVSRIRCNKDKMLGSAGNSERKAASLSLHKKIGILKETGTTVDEIIKNYDISTYSLQRMKQNKDRILNYAKESAKRGEEHNLARIKLPKGPEHSLTLRQKIKFLAELEKGKTVRELVKIYGVSLSTGLSIERKKYDILNVANAMKWPKLKEKSTENKKSYTQVSTVKEDNFCRAALHENHETASTDDNIANSSTQNTSVKHCKLDIGSLDKNVLKEEIIDVSGNDDEVILRNTIVKAEFTEHVQGKFDYDDLEFMKFEQGEPKVKHSALAMEDLHKHILKEEFMDASGNDDETVSHNSAVKKEFSDHVPRKFDYDDLEFMTFEQD